MCVFLLLLNPPCALSLVQTAFSRQGAQKQAQVRFPNDYTMPYSLNQAFFTKKQRKTEVLRRKSQNVVSVACKPSSVEGGHLSRPTVTDGFKRNPESIDGPSQSLFRFLLRAGFTSRTSRQAAGELLPHLSTLTRQACGISLLHFPWGRPRRALPGALPCGARTFLTPFGARPPGSLTNGRYYTINAVPCQFFC